MKRLLFLSPAFPYPPDKGWNVRIFNLLRACAENFEVTLIAPPAENEEGQKELERYCTKIIPVIPAESSLKKRILISLGLLEKVDLPRVKIISGYQQALSSINMNDFDLLWVERRDIYSLLRKHAGKIILDLDDIEHKKLWREIMLRTSTFSKLKGLPRFLGLFLWDIFATSGAKAVIVCSEEDKAYLKRLGISKAESIPNGTSIKIAASTGTADRKAVFLGNMLNKANSDAVLHFDQDILPLLEDPHFQLDVIGNKPTNTNIYSPHINFLGFVDDIGSELRKYKTMVAPLRFGGGTKLKVIDGMASGVPLVTTSVGSEGLNITHNVHALVADTPEDFASALKKLLKEDLLANKLSENAQKLVAERYGWDDIRKNTAHWLTRQNVTV